MNAAERVVEEGVLAPIRERPNPLYRTVCLVLSATLAWALVAWGWQIHEGLGVTGLNSPVFWGLYIVNFVFFIGISHAGTLISSVLRITGSGWRRPFTRLAEAITVFSLPFGAISVVVDLGRPDRVLNPLWYAHFSSAILWDVVCISTYLITSCLYFYLALIPDLAVCRDRLGDAAGWRAGLYRRLSLGWTGSAAQWRMLNRLMGGMAIFLFALVVTVHTNVSFIFGITTKPGWHSTIISPFFVLGAIYQGVAAMLVFAVVFRKMFHLQKFMRREHFQSASRFLLALACFWFYAMCIEHLFAFYTNEPAEMAVVRDKFFGEYSVLFWIMFTLNFPLPLVILSFPRFRTPFKLGVLGVLINIGMWLERFLIIVPSGANPYLPWGYGHYSPSWVEWSITAGWFAGFTLLLLVFARHFPILTMWEVKEDLEKGEKAAPAEEEASPAGSSPSLVAATGD